jgi:Zn-dependent protease
MSKNKISLGKILGIPIGLDYSWFLVFALLTWTLAVSYFPAEFKGWPVAQYWLVGAVTTVMLFVSVLLHELGHSVIAMRYKISVRSITLFIFGGVAEIGAEPPSAAAEFWIAIAGPVVSFALAALFGLLKPIFVGVAPLLALVEYLAYINGTLALFNLIPGFPLDGGRVFRAIVWGATQNMRRATLVAANVGRVIAYLFIVVGVWQMLTGNFGNGLWIAFIGWFLESAAVSQVQQQLVHDRLAGHKVAQAMNRNYTAIPPDVTIQNLVDHHILDQGRRCFVVKQNDAVAGLLTLHHVKEIPRPEWPTTTVAQAMIPAVQIKSVPPEAELWAALAEMDRDGVNQLPVMTNGHVVGMLSREDVVSFMRTLREIGV